ncbi:MAG TPA: ATP-binding protein, partial [Acidobacteriota bacterium]|nr:ATP-binding protein [Acidobacteriota bacterium]
HVLAMHGEKVVLSTTVDITERKRAEVLRQALNEQEKLRLGAAVEQASDAVIMVDLDGTIRYVNAAFEAINRLPRAQAVGSSYFELLAVDPAAAAWVEKVVAQGRTWHGPLTRPLSDAKPVELELTISPAKDPSGKLVGGLITEKDVTQENALQRQVRQAQKMEALGTLAGGITHDFNNILGAIVINTELALLDLEPDDPGRGPLPLVLQAANRGKDLVKQIITFSRQREWERKPVEIVPIVTEGTLFLRSTLPKDITIRETIDPRSGVVMADPSHIQQIMVNLCQNAALAMPNGGLLEIRLAPLEVDTAFALRHPDLKAGSYVSLTIKDTGCGMSNEVMERIFEPFFTTRGQGRGSGLGLAVVHGIVKSYEGAIIVHSELDKGSTFDIYLPRLEVETLTRETTVPLEPDRGEERILLVEDEADQRNSLAQALEVLGYNVSTSPDGSSALAIFRKDPGAFDIVVTDQSMPGMNGLALAEGVAALRPDIPIILCTGFSEKIDRGVVGRNGVREIIMKPFTVPEITRLIRKVVGPPLAKQDSIR